VKKRKTNARAQILRAADTLFAQQGYERTSLDQILDAARVSRSNLYYHFRSKRALLREVLALWLSEARSELLPPVENGALPAPERIRALVRALGRRITRIGPKCGCPVLNLTIEFSGPGSSRAPELDRFFRGLQSAIEDCLREGIQRGELRQDLEARGTAHLVLAAMQGAAVMARKAGTIRPVQECSQELFLLLNEPPTRAREKSARSQATLTA
jgi:AcrR family transcriptional regulator